MRMLSNATGVTSFISIEIGAILDSGGHPVDVGVWAQGSTSYTSVLFGGIKLSLNLHIPDATTQGGRAIANGWEIDFPFSLTSTVEIPFIGSATGKNDTTKVIAAVHKNSDARLVLFAETATKNILMESKCGLTVTISSEDLVTWHYEAYATIDVAGERAGYNVHYTNRDLLIFSGSLK
ncbi:hypothetical protein FOL47_005462 [Perkinsus chesapeaki]|uniref:Uncharacterized protein n=1 Tax=Perkinsus chesapeaki TaxID=330153 RepID=A0A7J6LYD2_PERCH|nr:hypothetical protein FOL47_005462 [Perkinsus chesapeaki]